MASKYQKFVNINRATVLAERAAIAAGFLSRLRGLLFSPPLQKGEGLLIVPCNSIHMLGMQYSIDVVFFDKELSVVGSVESIAPGQISRCFPSAKSCLELPAGTIAESGTRIGDQVAVADVDLSE